MTDLKAGLSSWETPRRIAILVGATAIITAVVAGWAGYDAARHPALPLVIVFQPGAIQITLDAQAP